MLSVASGAEPALPWSTLHCGGVVQRRVRVAAQSPPHQGPLASFGLFEEARFQGPIRASRPVSENSSLHFSAGSLSAPAPSVAAKEPAQSSRPSRTGMSQLSRTGRAGPAGLGPGRADEGQAQHGRGGVEAVRVLAFQRSVGFRAARAAEWANRDGGMEEVRDGGMEEA